MARFDEKLRARLAEIKAAQGRSEADIARALGFSARRFNNYVNGDREPDLATFRKICLVLELSPNEVLDYPTETQNVHKKPVNSSDSDIPPEPAFGQNTKEGEKGKASMGDAKALLIRQVLDLSDEEAAAYSQLITTRAGGPATRPYKRGPTTT